MGPLEVAGAARSRPTSGSEQLDGTVGHDEPAIEPEAHLDPAPSETPPARPVGDVQDEPAAAHRRGVGDDPLVAEGADGVEVEPLGQRAPGRVRVGRRHREAGVEAGQEAGQHHAGRGPVDGTREALKDSRTIDGSIQVPVMAHAADGQGRSAAPIRSAQ